MAAWFIATSALPGLAQAQAYAGLAVGSSRIALTCGSPVPCEYSARAFKVFAGQIVVPGVAVEGQYYDQGKGSATNSDSAQPATLQSRGAGVQMMLMAHGSDRVSFFGKAGVLLSRTRLDTPSTQAEWHLNGGWGVGTGCELSPSISMRLEFERVIFRYRGDKHAADLFTLGVLHRF